jgi:hypothetical protein
MGKPHEIFNKELLADLIAEAIANVTLKVNPLSYDVWSYFEVTATPYNYCSFVEVDILGSLGVPAMELETTIATGFECEIKWDPGNVNNTVIHIDEGSTISLNKRIDKFYIHPLSTSGVISFIAEGFLHWDC